VLDFPTLGFVLICFWLVIITIFLIFTFLWRKDKSFKVHYRDLEKEYGHLLATCIYLSSMDTWMPPRNQTETKAAIEHLTSHLEVVKHAEELRLLAPETASNFRVSLEALLTLSELSTGDEVRKHLDREWAALKSHFRDTKRKALPEVVAKCKELGV